ncbi:hypothetical protein [Mahella sp.]|uniref:hypothetical protein n=1 Tax=Mahella sp. TaxID=2798721 RepID=UPI0025BA18D6|nr:hypothetical protein [Mahella sp.]
MRYRVRQSAANSQYYLELVSERYTSTCVRKAVYDKTTRTILVCCESCTKDGGRPSGRDWSGRPAKQPSAAVVKSYGSERRRKSPYEMGMWVL